MQLDFYMIGQYDYFNNKCIENYQVNLGCTEQLNKEACINQLTDQQNNRVYCFFYEKCRQVKEIQLQQSGCSEMFNKYACLSVQNQSCKWESQQCLQQQQTGQNKSQICNIFVTPVNPYTCSQLLSGLCMSSGFEGDFECIEIRYEQLSQLSCNEIGLNEEGCLALNKENQYCIFNNNKCQEITLSQIKSCDQNLGQFACLSILNKDLQCEWIDKKCRKFERDSEQSCETKNKVNVSVCQNQNGFCQYDVSKQKCKLIDKNHIHSIQCNTPGLSKLACLQINNQNCSFFNGKCQELSDLDLNIYQCHMELNKQACVNIKTHFQYCFWNGNNCERRYMNQDYDCPLKLNNNDIRVNGNVCQAISKYQKKCKYDQSINLCIESSTIDICNTPFINKFGCLSIIKNKEACQWTMQGCKNVQVIKYITTCNSLGSANPIACSQVLEIDEKVGCYFNILKQQCLKLSVEVAPNSTKQEILQYQKDLEMLRNIDCNDIGIGLNPIACSSITTRGVACRWNRDSCVKIENKKDIQTIPCLNLKYANYKACSYVQYGGEVCRYSQTIKGCINSIIRNMQCNQLGLNQFGCQLAEGMCQFINDQCQQSDESDTNTDPIQQTGNQVEIPKPTESPETCEITSPTKTVCVSFSSISLLCQWNKSKSSCESVEIKQNSYCADYNGIDVSVNSNVCASIICDFPDYNYLKGVQADKNRGYCYYNKLTFQCQIKKEFCNTKCCTESENYGINAHSCIKFSSNEPGDYCYFMNLRCNELTDDIVDLSNLDQIKLYYNENKLPCSSMNKNSCYMIDWSLEQRCYFNGIVCLNLNYSYYKDYSIFTQEPSVLNEHACLAIDGLITEQNTMKYFGYDNFNKRCKEILLDPQFQFATCEDVKGNRNICQRYTVNSYCKWDWKQLKCITIPLDEYEEIQTCDIDLNIKACTDIKKSSCHFSYTTDRCTDVIDFNVDCNHFETLGKVSWQVCSQIIKFGQQCEFRNYTCVDSTKISQSCDGSLANNRSCFKNTKGLCRWDPITFQCYINHQDISLLSCSDNINIELCKQITKDACIWNDVSNDCQVFNTMNSTDFEILNSNGNHKFNEKACLLITGDAYYYDTITQKCTKLTSKEVDCATYQLNKYACLYHTRTHHCFFDEDEVVPNKKCKPFIEEQSICTTKWQINIEVCMDIQHTCIFDLNTFQCKPFDFLETMTCSDLLNYSTNLQHPNKKVCSSVVSTLEESLGELLCFEDKFDQQQCKFQKYCFWSNYACKFFKLVYDTKDSASVQQQTIKECPDYEEIDTCTEEVVKDTTQSYSKERISKTENYWEWVNSTCIQHIIIYKREHTYYKIAENIKFCDICDCTIIEEYICNAESVLEIISPFIEVNTYMSDTSYYKIQANSDENNCQNLDCSQLSEYMCNTAKNNCLQQNSCQIQLDYPYDSAYQGDCLPEKNYIFSHWCHLKENKVSICSNTFSKALCLEISQNCIFDIQQGGCMQSIGNEHNIVDCSQIANSCYISSSSRAICQNGESSIKPGDQCKTVQKPHKSCVPLTTYQSSFLCSDILNTDAQPILCSKANDDCRFDGKVCITTMPTQKLDGKYPCDKSFSKSICIKCGCDYNYLGYCQETKQIPQVNLDKSNKYFLCYQVNILNTTNKMEICGKVDQACAYVGTDCYDATHYSCSDLLQYTVSLKACQKCEEYATKYDPIEQKCNKIDNNIVNSCDNLNQYACLRNTRGVKCKWDNFNCQSVLISKSDNIQCSILNFDACYSQQLNICWIDQITSLCVNYDPYKGVCDLLKTESLCVRSMYENCKWTQNKCIKNTEIPNNTCNNLNQYLCLNATNIACGWSDLYEKCYQLQFKSQPTSCIDFLQSDQQAFINRCNSYTCTQIKVQQGCIHDQYYKCRLIIPLDVISCQVASISNINEFACAKLAKGKCKFMNSVCEKTIESNLGCQSYLNQEACLYQNAACKFDIYCQSYTITSMNGIKTLFPYTSSVCKTANLIVKSIDGNMDIGVSLIYGVAQYKCLDITYKNMVINSCTYTGMNKYSCLLKTNQFCEYKDNQCRNIEQKVINTLKTCNSTLNQFSCTRLNMSCKFLNGECGPINENDNCISLSQEKSIVNFRTCLRDQQTACMFNDKTQNCEVITTPQNCKDLNYKGCIFFTQGYNCEFKESKCITSFGNPNCEDDINEDKCLSIITKGQYCYFNSKLGCKYIDTTKVDLTKCYKDGLQTNPFTCSQSQDIPCFFDKQTKQCIQYTDQTPSSYQQNYTISNISSFNKMTCQMFNQFKALMWQETCQVVKSSQLVYLKCDALLNRIACLSIKTPFQFCQYKNYQCINANLDDFKNVQCDQIRDINSGAFCALNTNSQPCQYNKSSFKCEIIDSTIISCVEKDPEEKGINKKGCEIDKINCIYDENCYRLNNSGYQFCRDIKVDSQFQCKQVTSEGCLIDQNICKKIYYQDYSQIKCEQASNRFGCVNIQTQNQFCQFDGEDCKEQNVKQYTDVGCLSIININHYSFCEQPRDIACTFDLKNSSCRNVYQQEVFSCERGLNKIACLTQTTKSLMCQFLDYCYGPNNGILNCTYNNNEQCCKLADQIDTCLNQKKYECEWTVNGCQAYQTRIVQCEQIINASFLVCASIKNTLCVYVPNQHNCQIQLPTTCGFSQTSLQCKRMKSVSCIWDLEREICIYSENSNYLSCTEVSQQSGNQRACMNVEVQGQLCIYKDEQCTLFLQQENINNCLDSINKNACLQQTINDCQWIQQVYQVKKFEYSDYEDVVQGECKPISNINQTHCSQNISYTACMKIKKIGQFCIWKDYSCQELNQLELYTPNQLILVNQNACSLVNNGDIVRYNQLFKNCEIVENLNELTCNPEIFGINKEACISIKNQPCTWYSIDKRCQYQDIENGSQTCEQADKNSISCSKFDIDQPCGYSNLGCKFVDINSIPCTYAGLNKYACLNILKYSCIWKYNEQTQNYYCDEYIPYTSCQLIPNNVNPKVCQLVEQDACYYDINQKQCKNTELKIINCETLGLNIKGCIQIDGCIYQESCKSLNKKYYLCNEYPIANYKVCKNAQDNCKFNELTSGCIQSNEELCDTKGLSQQGCIENNCQFINNQCKCNENFKDKDCDQINEIEKCNSHDHCIYNQNICKWIQCEDLPYTNCKDQQINQQYCYQNTFQQCKSAKLCEDIQNPASIQLYLNKKACIFNSDLQLYQLINCQILDQQKCLSYPKDCKFEQFCQSLTCYDLNYNNCTSDNCIWNHKQGICEEQIQCFNISDQSQCILMKYKNRKCQWVTQKNESFCTNSYCKFLTTKQQCNGEQVNGEICVKTYGDKCISCEEIKNSCICLQNNQLCDYDFNKNKCESKICSNYLEKEKCPNEHCEFQQNCIPKCKYIIEEEICHKNNKCDWQNSECKEKIENIKPNIQVWGLINIFTLSICILYF
ncbi:unnamed protein product [Paramecium pentaurelia]|uniref:Uncharacterized protein n=1 Tax=Paramecium pentaurelia TaxID=43138 RepID=A0A8S1UKF0_9CILI|nr:unnamed protein product [Paramecium pentaurelia]